MADIALANSGELIKNGTLVVSCSKTGAYNIQNVYVNNKPTLSDIETKYQERFDDPSYYYGDGTQGS